MSNLTGFPLQEIFTKGSEAQIKELITKGKNEIEVPVSKKKDEIIPENLKKFSLEDLKVLKKLKTKAEKFTTKNVDSSEPKEFSKTVTKSKTNDSRGV